MDNNKVLITVPLNITVSLGAAEQTAFAAADSEEDLLEKIEIDTNYSNRKGYREDFLGKKVPLPKLSPKLLKKVARFKDDPDEYVLKYFRHSVVHSAERKMPFYTAVNVDGKKEVKYSREGGGWIRDARINEDDQLNNKFYSKSGFDKGHMVRREDAEWGSSIEDAKKGSDDTFHYTNCCPQVAALNQAKKKGLWGKLEVFILENGARDDEHEMKINVFNGPVFSPSDPVFKGVQIPMKYWKIVTWVTKNKKLAATAFILSQESLVSDIEFEEFSFSEEFKDYQYKISKLEKEIGISFKDLSEVDTFANKNTDFEKIDSLEKITI